MNKKVYLAKTPLASGLDVDFVKSSLLRIPNIEIIENGSTIKAKDCVSLVIVKGDDFQFDFDNTEESTVPDSISKAILSFLKENDCQNIYVYDRKEEEDDRDDVERDFLLAYYVDSYNDDDELSLEISSYNDLSLLSTVSIDIDEGEYAYQAIPLRYSSEKYPVPEVDVVVNANKITSTNYSETTAKANHNHPLIRRFRI